MRCAGSAATRIASARRDAATSARFWSSTSSRGRCWRWAISMSASSPRSSASAGSRLCLLVQPITPARRPWMCGAMRWSRLLQRFRRCARRRRSLPRRGGAISSRPSAFSKSSPAGRMSCPAARRVVIDVRTTEPALTQRFRRHASMPRAWTTPRAARVERTGVCNAVGRPAGRVRSGTAPGAARQRAARSGSRRRISPAAPGTTPPSWRASVRRRWCSFRAATAKATRRRNGPSREAIAAGTAVMLRAFQQLDRALAHKEAI